MSQKFDVIIVGGGMGGLALALALAQQGRSVAVVERQSRPKPFARGELLQPNGLRILDHLGLLESVRKLPSYLANEFHFHRNGGGRLCTVDYRMLPPPWNYTLLMTPYHLLTLLFQKLEQTDLVHLFTETDFSDLLRHDGRVVGIRANRGARSIELQASVTVGSDGAFSQVRESLGIQSQVHTYREVYLTLIVPRPEGFHRDARYYLGKREILGMFPVSTDKMYLFFMVPADQLENIRRGPLNIVLKAIGKIDKVLKEPLETVESWKEVGVMPCVRVRAEKWTAEGAVLIGDAAHAMNPHVAQGRNQALEDVMVLTEVLQDAFQRGDFSNEVLRGYEIRRRRGIEVLQNQADEMVLFWNSGFFPLTWLRDRVFKQLDQDDQLRYKMLALIAGEGYEGFTLMDRLKASGFFPR